MYQEVLTDEDIVRKINPELKLIKVLKPGDYFGEITSEYMVKTNEINISKSEMNLVTLENSHY